MSTPKILFVRNKKNKKTEYSKFHFTQIQKSKFTNKANIPFHINKTGPCILKIQGPVYKYQKLYSKPQYFLLNL
ncbi:hypothetical protein BANORC5_31460 [Bacteroides nordii]|nr:hypothetical protein BANORC5_31460 [Bacteroides nordii]